jgi:serine/threonine protein kinase
MPCQLRLGFESDGVSDATEDAPEQLANYRIARHDDGTPWELGRGSMGITYRALDVSLDRPVAIKIVAPAHAGGNSAARERFLREARVAAQLRHPNIATVYQFGVDEDTGHFFYAMELVEGETLEERVRRTGPLDVATTIAIARQVVAALALAEKNALVHRDLKPANVMLVASDDAGAAPVVKIIDFGLAKALTATTDPTSLTQGEFVGTPAFASPEQFSRVTLDTRSDVYSLGVTLWFALTGKTPFRGRTAEEIQRVQESETLPTDRLRTAGVPPRVIAVLRMMLALEPAARPGTSALAAKLQGIATTNRPTRRLVFAAAALLLFSLGAFWLVHRSGPPVPAVAFDEGGTSNPAASEAYLKGIYIWNTRDGTRFAEAERYLRHAIALDPKYARAYAGLSCVLQFMASPPLRAKKFAEAATAGRKALELDPNLAEAHASLALIAMNYDWDWPGAEREFQSALALNPQYATAHHWYAEFLCSLGRFDEALREINLAIQLNPTLPVIHFDAGKILIFARRYPEAEAPLKEGLELDPNYGGVYFWLAQTHALQGRFPEAFAELKELERLAPSSYTSGLSAYVYGLAHDRAAAEKLLAQTQARLAPEDDMLPLVYAYIGVGDKEKALTYLERDCDIHATTMTALRVGPHFDSLRSDPRFQALLRRVHFLP